MRKTLNKISKLISYWLRHKPEEGNLTLDDFGWATIEDILVALKENGTEFNKSDLIELSNSFDKVRWKIDKTNNKIKATHGHSISILQELEPKTPPEILYHGTATKFLESIIVQGLKSKQRQYVHLSETIDMAKEIGARHGTPFIIEIETKKLVDNGWDFYKTEQDVWLTSEIPVKYLSFMPWDFTIDNKIKDTLLNQLKIEVGNKHILYAKTNMLVLVAKYGPSDDYLFNNPETNEYFVVHLTWSNRKEKDTWPITKQYDSFSEFISKRLMADQSDWNL